LALDQNLHTTGMGSHTGRSVKVISDGDGYA